MGFSTEAGQGSRHQTRRMETQRAHINLLRPFQRRSSGSVERFPLFQSEQADVAVGGVDQQIISHQVEQQHLARHLSDATEGIVQAGHVARVNADLVPISDNAVAAHDQLLLPPEQSASHDEILFLRFVAEEFPAAGDQRVESEARTPGHGQVLTAAVQRGETQWPIAG